MNFILLTFAALSAHFSCVQAYQFSTTKSCTTQYGEKSVSIKTSSYTTTTPITVLNKYTTTPTIIITPSLQTTTSTTTTTVTATAATTSIDTFTDTASTTFTSTTITTLTTDTTTTITTTTSIATSTVPTPAGFTPITLEPGFVPKEEFVEAGRPAQDQAVAKNYLCPPIGKPGQFSQYPQKVICGVHVVARTTITKTYTATNYATSTVPPPTSAVTSTFTTTETSTSAAALASTATTTMLSFTTTTTLTTTTTTTATQTNTIVQAASTVYAACDSNNVVNHANGNQGINEIDVSNNSNPSKLTEIEKPDVVACCEQCQQTMGCTGYAYAEPVCYYITSEQCDGSQNFGHVFISFASSDPSSGFTLGNGQCGQFGNGGSEP